MPDKITPVKIVDRKEPYWKELNKIIDPELNLGIVDLGLIYKVDIEEDSGHCTIFMTLTSPACPVGPVLVQQVQDKMLMYKGVTDAEVRIVWEPFWTEEMIDPEVKDLILGF